MPGMILHQPPSRAAFVRVEHGAELPLTIQRRLERGGQAHEFVAEQQAGHLIVLEQRLKRIECRLCQSDIFFVAPVCFVTARINAEHLGELVLELVQALARCS